MYLSNGTLLQGGKYKIIRHISSGGFGNTYEALDVNLDKRVAIKEFFVKDFCSRAADTTLVTITNASKKPLIEHLRKKFWEEARAIAKMEHENIVKVQALFEENGTAYYVMDFIDGESVHNILKRRGALPEKEALPIILKIADVLGYMHEQNRFHLDVKPANIMLRKDGKVVLIDFGSSKQYAEVDGENTTTLAPCYTPGYAPSEQMNPRPTKFTAATDIYALGATLYKMFTGITPPSAIDLQNQVKTLSPLPDNISVSIRRAIENAMKPLRSRTQNIGDFLKNLKEDTIYSRGGEDTIYGGGNEDTINGGDGEKTRIEAEALRAEQERRRKEEQERKVREEAERKARAEAERKRKEEEERKRKEEERRKYAERKSLEAAAKVRAEEERKRKEKNEIWGWLLVALLVVVGVLLGMNGGCVPTTHEEPNDTIVENNPNIVDGHECVDLGLSVKWATMNVGASKPEEYGDYFAWGETSPKTDYNCSTYFDSVNGSDSNFRKYATDKKTTLDPEDDAAHMNWGGSWRMPTKAEQDELREKCTWNWATQNGKTGYKVTSKTNGNSIFLPAAGYRYEGSLNDAGSYGYYWSSLSPDDSSFACYLEFDSDEVCLPHYSNRYDGFSVRGVCP